MARKKSSSAEDFMDLVSMMPWWAGITLAFVLYLILHQLAQLPQTAVAQPGQVGAMAGRAMIAAVAFAAQFLVPLICVFAAIGSFMRRRKRASLIDTVSQAGTADALNGMSWREFEMLVGEAFRLQGFTVAESMTAGPDGGVDLVLRKGSEKFLVQCKQWKAFKVGVQVVRELLGVMTAEGAVGGFVVTSGRFTPDATEFSLGRNITLIDGPKLLGLIRTARASLGASAMTPSSRNTVDAPVAASAAPSCPTCQSTMVRRTAKKGTNAGSQFWGCARYPACRGTR